MSNARSSSNLLSRLRDLAHCGDGAAAVEFAALLPFMLAVYLGGVEIGDGVAINRKVTITARDVADLASQYTAIYNADMTTILGAASTIIAPYPSSPLTVTVSEISTDNTGKSTVTWSQSSPTGSALTPTNSFTLPGTLAVNGTSLILGQVTYAYTPTLGYVITGTMNLSSQIFMSPRQTQCIPQLPSYPCP
jgi:Flp pilus assembly protein TadG